MEATAMGELTGLAARPLESLAVLVALSLVPFAAVMLTSFSKMSIVLSLFRSALGSQQAPPAVVLTGLAAILSGYVMAPVAEEVLHRARALPASNGESRPWGPEFAHVGEPLRDFLLKHAAPEERRRFVDLALELRGPTAQGPAETDLGVVIPAFVLTELREAFQLGFVVFLPFLVVYMVIANILLALGMQTLSPTQVSLPLKLLLFVAADGWGLLARGLVLGYR
jgi:type III secretion protein R